MMREAFSMLFPGAGFLAGAYLIHRGIIRANRKHKSICGPAKGESFPSPISGRDCIYSRVVVEYYQGGHAPWRRICAIENRAPFSLQGCRIDPKYADFQIGKKTAWTGYIRKAKGFLFSLALDSAKDTIDFTKEVSASEFLDDSIVKALAELDGAKEKIHKHMKKPLRVSEYTIPADARICAVQDPAFGMGEGMRGTVEFPLIISDADIKGSMEGKAMASILLGISMMALSIALFLFIFGASS